MNTSLLPNPLFDYHQLFNLLLPVTSLLVAAGLLSVFHRAAAPADQLRGLVQVTAIVALLAFFDPAVQTTKACVQQLVEDGMKARPWDVSQKFSEKIMASGGQDEETSLWNQLTSISTQLFQAMVAAAIVLIALLATTLFFLAYLAQELALELGIGLAPILVGFLLLPATRSIGVQFLLYMLEIALFPLGWGAASLVSDQLIEFATKYDLAAGQTVTDRLSFATRNVFGALLLAVWIILSTLVAPFAILRAVTSGVHLSTDAARAVRQFVRH